MSESAKAVFLSHASQDAEAAYRICEALRAASVEVWFDQSELRGGDAWDQQISRQIKDCALFIPIISANNPSTHRELLSARVALGRPGKLTLVVKRSESSKSASHLRRAARR